MNNFTLRPRLLSSTPTKVTKIEIFLRILGVAASFLPKVLLFCLHQTMASSNRNSSEHDRLFQTFNGKIVSAYV